MSCLFHPFSASQREEYYSDSLTVAKLFEIPERLTPLSYAAFHSYMGNMLASDVITVSNQAREIARELFSASIEGNLLFLGSAVGIGLLPERLRNEFGFRWSRRREAWLARIATLSRRARGHLPLILCSSPMATWSQLRTVTQPHILES